MANKSMNVYNLRIIQETWSKLLIDYLPESDKNTFIQGKKAVDMYINGAILEDIEKETHIHKTRIKRLVERCLQVDETGNMYGYSALLPKKNIKKMNGNFNKLLIEYPSLIKFISGNYLGNKKYTLEKNMNLRTLHSKFLDECRHLGIQNYEYPFSTKSLGYVSLINYVKKIKNINPDKSIQRENKDMIQKFCSTGQGQKYSFDAIAPYQVVQIDGHKIDIIYSVEVEDKEGFVKLMPATRMWLIAVIDVATRTILGYSLSQNENYNQSDVLKAIRNSIIPHKNIEFKITGLNYPPKGGFPSDLFTESKWALFDTIMLDNAKSHLAKNVVNKLTMSLKCAINFGSVATPETRGIVERFFGTLERGGYHKLPATTGQNIYDAKRKNPEKASVKYNITFDEIAEITEYLIAEYNNSAHSSLENQTPLQAMESKMHEAFILPCKADSEMQEEVKDLTNIILEKTVRGGYNKGKRPYISYMGVEYHSEGINFCMDLIGKQILISINPDDVSHVKAYTLTGEELGNLVAVGEWGHRPHSLKTREAALKRKNENKALNTPFTPHLYLLENEYIERAKVSRRARTKADIVRKEAIKLPENQNNIENDTLIEKFDVTDITLENFTKEQLNTIDSISIEEAYERGLFDD